MSGQKPKIVVIGSFIIDIGIRTPRFPGDGETVIGEQLRLGPGGKGSNQATAASRAGGEVTMIAKIGADHLARIFYDHYQAEGMTTEFTCVTDERETGAAVIEVDTITGQNRIIVFKAANELLTAGEVRRAEARIRECDIVLLQLESSIEAVQEAQRLAKKYVKPVILNPAPYQEIPDGLFDGVDYLTPNETEAEYFTGLRVSTREEASAAAAKLLGSGAKNIIITLGKQGALLKNAQLEILVETTDLKPVDTTGAGDAFNGGLAVALAEGMDPVRAVRFANCAASISVTRYGTSVAMPDRNKIDELYQTYYSSAVGGGTA